MERLCKLLMENEMWIEKKTYELAAEKGTIGQPFEHKQKQSEVIRKFVSIISEAMVQKINSMGNIRYEEDRKIPFSAMSFIILQIQVHIDKSVELRHFIWFEKCLRRSYVYFVKYFVSDINLKSKYMLFVMDFFDDLETEIFVQWDKCREKKIVESLKKEDNYDYFANNQDEYTKMNDILKDSEANLRL
jgi:hypothetical protein